MRVVTAVSHELDRSFSPDSFGCPRDRTNHSREGLILKESFPFFFRAFFTPSRAFVRYNSYLSEQMPRLYGASRQRAELLDDLEGVLETVSLTRACQECFGSSSTLLGHSY